jgi:hypothetical protein
MKKAFFKLMLVVLGLNVFTACYGPAPGWQEDYPDPEATEQTDDTKAAPEEEAAQEPVEEADKPAE